uniref:S24 family peptidase n=1 Tax=Halomonas sp. TaxID=1486246 RepID=UPI00345B0909
MLVTYLGPVVPGLTDPCVLSLGVRDIPLSCYLVEVSDEAGVEGKIQESDVLVVDEARALQHGDLALMDVEGQLRLFHCHRIGGSFRMIPAGGGQGIFARPCDVRGVVVAQHRSPHAI